MVAARVQHIAGMPAETTTCVLTSGLVIRPYYVAIATSYSVVERNELYGPKNRGGSTAAGQSGTERDICPDASRGRSEVTGQSGTNTIGVSRPVPLAGR
jgi:hypothetical protein